MAKSIRSFPKEKRAEVIARRLKGETKGLGYWAAVDAKNKLPPSK